MARHAFVLIARGIDLDDPGTDESLAAMGCTSTMLRDDGRIVTTFVVDAISFDEASARVGTAIERLGGSVVRATPLDAI